MTQIGRPIDALARALDYHGERHNVIASNVANANTPGFRPLELTRAEAPALGGSLRMSRTDGEHLPAVGQDALNQSALREDAVTAPGLDGNSVSLEHEMAKLAANDLRFESAARMISMHLGMMRYAASDGSG